jgi:hypothetical protein
MPYDDCVNTPGSFPAQTDEKPFHTLAASDDIPRSKSFCHFDPQAKNLVVGRKNAISFASLRSARDDNPWFCAACQQFHPRFESRAEQAAEKLALNFPLAVLFSCWGFACVCVVLAEMRRTWSPEDVIRLDCSL